MENTNQCQNEHSPTNTVVSNGITVTTVPSNGYHCKEIDGQNSGNIPASNNSNNNNNNTVKTTPMKIFKSVVVPINEHHKSLRSETLFITKDNNDSKSGFGVKFPIFCCGFILGLIISIISLTVITYYFYGVGQIKFNFTKVDKLNGKNISLGNFLPLSLSNDRNGDYNGIDYDQTNRNNTTKDGKSEQKSVNKKHKYNLTDDLNLTTKTVEKNNLSKKFSNVSSSLSENWNKSFNDVIIPVTTTSSSTSTTTSMASTIIAKLMTTSEPPTAHSMPPTTTFEELVTTSEIPVTTQTSEQNKTLLSMIPVFTESSTTTNNTPLTPTSEPQTTTVMPQTTKSEPLVTTRAPITSEENTTLLSMIPIIVGTSTTTKQTASDQSVTTFEAATTTSELPTTTSELPTTTSEEPMTTSELPMTTSELPTTTSELPKTTSEEPRTTSELPKTTSEEPRTTSELPMTTSELPTTTSEEPTTKSETPTTATTSKTQDTTSEFPSIESESHTTTSEPPMTRYETPIKTTTGPITSEENATLLPIIPAFAEPSTTTKQTSDLVTTSEPRTTPSHLSMITSEAQTTTSETPVTIASEAPVTTTSETPMTTTSEKPVTTTSEIPVTTSEASATTITAPITLERNSAFFPMVPVFTEPSTTMKSTEKEEVAHSSTNPSLISSEISNLQLSTTTEAYNAEPNEAVKFISERSLTAENIPEPMITTTTTAATTTNKAFEDVNNSSEPESSTTTTTMKLSSLVTEEIGTNLTMLNNSLNSSTESNAENSNSSSTITNDIAATNETKQNLTCPEKMFPCLSIKNEYECKGEDLICDGLVQCLDGFDERNCTQSCGQDFNCGNTSYVQCLPKNMQCDGIWDCAEGNDERNCYRINCVNGAVSCQDKSNCILPKQICDGKYDCKDHSDELSCVEPSACESSGKFMCENKLCIDYSLRCDGIVDCTDGLDEINCTCKESEFQCFNGECVPAESRCNGITECRDNSDEWSCVRIDENNVVQVMDPVSNQWSLICHNENMTKDDADEICHEMGFGVSSNYSSILLKSDYWLTMIGAGIYSPTNCTNNLATKINCVQNHCSVKRDLENKLGTSREVPSLVKIKTEDSITDNDCLAEIITPVWLLGSADCFRDGMFYTSVWSNETTKIGEIDRIIKHPHSSKFRSLLFRDYDLSLIKLKKPINLNEDQLSSICLPEQNVQTDITCFLKKFKDTVDPITYNVDDLSLCNGVNHYNGSLSKRQLCSKTRSKQQRTELVQPNETEEQMSLGLPLVCLSSESKWFIAGFLSYFSQRKSFIDHPVVFSNVYTMRNFIEKVIGYRNYGIAYDNRTYTIMSFVEETSVTTTDEAVVFMKNNSTSVNDNLTMNKLLAGDDNSTDVVTSKDADKLPKDLASLVELTTKGKMTTVETPLTTAGADIPLMTTVSTILTSDASEKVDEHQDHKEHRTFVADNNLTNTTIAAVTEVTSEETSTDNSAADLPYKKPEEVSEHTVIHTSPFLAAFTPAAASTTTTPATTSQASEETILTSTSTLLPTTTTAQVETETETKSDIFKKEIDSLIDSAKTESKNTEESDFNTENPSPIYNPLTTELTGSSLTTEKITTEM